MTEQIITYQHRKIRCYIQGALSQKIIIFIHGNSLSAQTFTEQFKGIKNIPLLAFDLPGHGLSKPAAVPDNVYSVPGFVEVLKAVIAELGLNNYIIGGHIAIEAAEELKGAKGLVLFGTPPIGIPPALDKAFLPHEAAPLLFKETLTEAEVNILAESQTNALNKEMLKKAIQLTDGRVRSHIAASVGKGLFKNETEIMKNTTLPVAIFHGEQEQLISKEYIGGLTVPTLWKNKIHVITGAKHCPQLEQATVFNKLLTDFYTETFKLK